MDGFWFLVYGFPVRRSPGETDGYPKSVLTIGPN